MKFPILLSVFSLSLVCCQRWPAEFRHQLKQRNFQRPGGFPTIAPLLSTRPSRRPLLVYENNDQVVTTEAIIPVTTTPIRKVENTSSTTSSTMRKSMIVVEMQTTTEVSNKNEKDENALFLLPASSKKVLSQKIDESLVCPGSGFYADVANNCEIFHFCVETARPDGSGNDMRQYSFFCGQNLIFDQYTLNCRRKENAVPCEYAPEFFSINERIAQGRKDVLIHREDDKVNQYYDESIRRKNL